MKLLTIGLDYLMLKDDKVRGDVRERQLVYAKSFDEMHSIVYSPKSLNFQREQWSEKLTIYPTNSSNKANFIFDAYKVASEIIKNNKIEALTVEDPFSTGFIGCRLKKKFNIPLNMQVHIDFIDNQYWMSLRPLNKFFNFIGKRHLKKASTIRCGTHVEKEKIAALGISKKNIFVIPVNQKIKMFQGVDGSDVRKQYLSDKFEHLLLFTGRLVKQKDIPNLLHAFAKILKTKPKTLLLIVGTGSEEAPLKKLSKELNLSQNIIFTGSIDHNEVPKYLSACDIYVVPSIYEGTCIAMTEAMSAGKAVVVTKFAGAQDLIEHRKNGILVDIKNPQTMANEIVNLLDNPALKREIEKNAPQRIKDVFANDQNIEKVIEMWMETVKLRK
jgi:1,2-diacylglycerol 3-alpha-glucosyltransferase